MGHKVDLWVSKIFYQQEMLCHPQMILARIRFKVKPAKIKTIGGSIFLLSSITFKKAKWIIKLGLIWNSKVWSFMRIILTINRAIHQQMFPLVCKVRHQMHVLLKGHRDIDGGIRNCSSLFNFWVKHHKIQSICRSLIAKWPKI